METDIQVTYWLDRANRIADTSESWDTFALANGGESCVSARVRGKPISTFIAGDAARMWMNALLTYARVSNEPVTKPYRCDSPTEKRYMEISVEPAGKGLIALSHRIIKLEAKPQRARTLRNTEDKLMAVARCSICGRLRLADGWREPDCATSFDNALKTPKTVFDYTVCGDCAKLLNFSSV